MGLAALIVPVKDFGRAKQRLAAALSPDARRGLVEAMFADVMGAVCAAGLVGQTTVVTAEPAIADLARQFGVRVLPEPEGEGVNEIVDRAVAELGFSEDEAVLILAADIPLVTADEVLTLLAAAPDGPGVVIGRNLEGEGTNALLRRPPLAVPAGFGPGSFGRYLAAAMARNLPVRVLDLPGVALDIDTPQDLARLKAAGRDCRTLRYVQGRGL